MPTPPMAHAPWPQLLYSIGIAVCLVIVATPWPPTWALNNETTRATLRGLSGVEIEIAPVPPELENAGVTGQLLQAEVEQQLRRAGIDIFIFTRQEASTRPDVAFFAISVSTLSHDLGVYAYSVDLALYQSATLRRDSTPLSVPTWTTGSLGLVGESRLRTIMKTVNTSVDHFIQAYRAMNPRAASAVPPTTRAATVRIRQVQERLRTAGLLPGPADGRLGPQTQQALRQYQRTKGLHVTGELDTKTLKALDIR
jgi:hypothetical protein